MSQSKIIKLLGSAVVIILGVIFITRTIHKDSFDNKEDSFTTVTGSIDGHDYVDLGLSVKWSTHNIGAVEPEDYGDYFAWGETESKSSYTWLNYRFRTSGNSYSDVMFSKYNTSSSYGNVDNKTKLEEPDDVAHVKWGGNWRMPTKDEYTELLNNCTWTWTTQNGIKGYKVTSNMYGYTDRTIFLPAAGYCNDSGLHSVGSYSNCWSSSLHLDLPLDAWFLSFSKDNHHLHHNYRYFGITVRPVYP